MLECGGENVVCDTRGGAQNVLIERVSARGSLCLLEECHRCRLTLTSATKNKNTCTHSCSMSEWACTRVYMKLRRSSFRCANEQRKRVVNGCAHSKAALWLWRKLTSELDRWLAARAVFHPYRRPYRIFACALHQFMLNSFSQLIRTESFSY